MAVLQPLSNSAEGIIVLIEIFSSLMSFMMFFENTFSLLFTIFVP